MQDLTPEDLEEIDRRAVRIVARWTSKSEAERMERARKLATRELLAERDGAPVGVRSGAAG